MQDVEPIRQLHLLAPATNSGRLTQLRNVRTVRLVQYEWDATKAQTNRRKHGVDFPDAIEALEDPYRLEELDERYAYEEERTTTIGMASSRVLFVVTTSRGEDSCRIISARKATRHEEDQYYKGDRESW